MRSSDIVMQQVLSLAGRELLADAHRLVSLRDPLRRLADLLDEENKNNAHR